MLEQNIHRIGVVRPDDKLSNILSQSDVINWLHNTYKTSEQEFDELFDMTVEDLLSFELHSTTGLRQDGVYTVNFDVNVIDAFKRIKELKVGGLGILDNTGKIVGNISAFDITRIDLDNFSSLSQKVGAFALKNPRISNVAHVTKSQRLHEVLSLFVSTGVHRIYVVDSNNSMIPSAVITPLLLLHLLWTVLHS